MNKTIELESVDDLKKRFEEMAHILHNLRFYTKYWNEHGGYYAREKKNYWQEKADACLDKNGMTLHNNINSVTVIKY